MASGESTPSTGSSENLEFFETEWAETEKEKKNTSYIIYVANLPPEKDDLDLEDMFAEYGRVISAVVMVDDSGNSRGYGFVRYETKEEAENAIEKANGKEIDGKKLFVDIKKSLEDRKKYTEEQKNLYTNIYIGNISHDVNEEELKRFFETYGSISSVKIERENGKSKGFGFINYKDHLSAVTAVEKLNGKGWHGRIITVSRAQKKNERRVELKRSLDEMKEKQKGRSIKVTHINLNVKETRLCTIFKRYGTIESCKMIIKNNASEGYAYICFSSSEEATKAQKKMSGYCLLGKRLQVTLIDKEDKEERNEKAAEKTGVNQTIKDEKLTAEDLESYSEENRKLILGETLFPLIRPIYPALAEKITGMLLEMQNDQLLYLINHPELLRAKVIEAVLTLSVHRRTKTVKRSLKEEPSYHGCFSLSFPIAIIFLTFIFIIMPSLSLLIIIFVLMIFQIHLSLNETKEAVPL